ncbi:MAG: hypothetical protein AAF297_08190 [Planctomycetota bacterium]
MTSADAFPSPIEPQGNDFASGYFRTVQALQTSLIAVHRTLRIESASSREISRQLGVDKSLAWKLSSLVAAEDLRRVAGYVPRSAGARLLIAAIREQGVEADLVRNVETAFMEFEAMVHHHAGDRDVLEVMVDGLGASASEGLVKHRKLAFRGNVGIWGVQAATRLSSHVLALDDSGERIRYVQLGALYRFRRHRPGPAWPLYSFNSYNDDGTLAESRLQPLQQSPGGSESFLIPEFCRGSLPAVSMHNDPRAPSCEIGDGTLGRCGECDLFFGHLDAESKTAVRDEHNQLGELLCAVNTPIEMLILDLLVQRELGERIDPTALVYGRATGHPHGAERRDERSLIPFTEPLRQLEPGPQMTSTQLAPGYMEASDMACRRLGRELEQFTGWRLLLPFPVMPSAVSLKFRLPS